MGRISASIIFVNLTLLSNQLDFNLGQYNPYTLCRILATSQNDYKYDILGQMVRKSPGKALSSFLGIPDLRISVPFVPRYHTYNRFVLLPGISGKEENGKWVREVSTVI